MVCAVCENPLTGSQRKYCSTKCKNRATQLRRNADGRNAARDKERYAKERDRRISWQKQYYADNKDAVSEYQKRWRAANTEKRRVSNQKRRALKMENPGYVEVTPEEWIRIKNQYRGACAYCGTKCVATMDHVVPLCKGGRHAPGNILPACGPCNSRKQHRFLSVWRAEQRKGGDPVALCA